MRRLIVVIDENTWCDGERHKHAEDVVEWTVQTSVGDEEEGGMDAWEKEPRWEDEMHQDGTSVPRRATRGGHLRKLGRIHEVLLRRTGTVRQSEPTAPQTAVPRRLLEHRRWTRDASHGTAQSRSHRTRTKTRTRWKRSTRLHRCVGTPRDTERTGRKEMAVHHQQIGKVGHLHPGSRRQHPRICAGGMMGGGKTQENPMGCDQGRLNAEEMAAKPSCRPVRRCTLIQRLGEGAERNKHVPKIP